MTLKLHEALTSQMVIAHRIVETIVLRSRGGEVYTVEIGTALQPKTGPAYGAKVSRVSPTTAHVAVCLAPTIEEVFALAQEQIADALLENAQESSLTRRKQVA